jgi:hypothetical protein
LFDEISRKEPLKRLEEKLEKDCLLLQEKKLAALLKRLKFTLRTSSDP